MRPIRLAPSIAAVALATVATSSFAAGPFTRPSTVPRGDAPPPTVTAPAAPAAPTPEMIQAQQEREEAERVAREEEAKRKAQEEKRKKLGLKEGQELAEIEFKGARVGTFNGVNVYRGPNGKSYFFEGEKDRKFMKVVSEDSYKAPPPEWNAASMPAAVDPKAKQPAPNLPSSVGRPAPRK